ncbi:MAG: hypothetical protein C0467_23985 [Planctomycetaceae bacterium]|nr:hypothetical protein [Planctomycetaceae bacterium]
MYKSQAHLTRDSTVNGKVALGVESLESRDCPSTVNITNGTLTVLGTAASETITVSNTSTAIVVDGRAYSRAGVSRVVISAGAGNDTIINNSAFISFIYGGMGNDTIYGGTNTDYIFGGSGADKLYGRNGNDTIWGGGGVDVVSGGAGTNVVREGSPVRVQSNTAIELEIIRLVNVERGKVGLPPLKVSNALNYATMLHSTDMAAMSPVVGGVQAMQHTLFGTVRPQVSDRFDLAGYDTWSSSFAGGENIAYGFTSAASVVAAWMGSAGHRANILNTNFTEIGVSVRASANGGLYFTQNFGKQT